jgi:hypothetical protein
METIITVEPDFHLWRRVSELRDYVGRRMVHVRSVLPTCTATGNRFLQEAVAWVPAGFSSVLPTCV